MLDFQKSDIDWELARRAHSGTSFVPEKRADGVVNSYMAEMVELVKEFGPFATDENHVDLAIDLETYRVGYIDKLNAYLHAHSRVVSTMITGPANFPTRANEKRCNSVDKRRDEWLAWRKKAKSKLHQKYNPVAIARAPISSGDPEAIAKLQAKIDRAEKKHEMMKAANKVLRKDLSVEAKVEALTELGLSEDIASKLLMPDFAGRVGFASFQLTNNKANIRRMKKRIEAIQHEQERGPVEDKVVAGVTVIENKELNRLQLVFPGKPSSDVRSLLKSRGFRWAPSKGAWQRQLTDNARYAAQQILARLEEAE